MGIAISDFPGGCKNLTRYERKIITMKKTLFIITTILVLILLAGCGTFKIESDVVTESTSTPVAGPASNEEISIVEGQNSPTSGSNSPAIRLGLIEIMLILGGLVLASLAVGAFFIIRDRTPKSDYPPSTDNEDNKKSVGRLLRFRPSVGAIILALVGWAGIFGFGAILLVIGLLVPVRSTTETWTPTLTMPSAILIGENMNERHIRFIPEDGACVLRPISDQSQQMGCDVRFEGAPLSVDVELQDGMFWSCSATYDDQPVPCRASFNSTDKDTYVVVESNLGLSQERFQQLVKEKLNEGWTETDWIWLGRGIVGVLSLIVFVVLWRQTGSRIDISSGPALIMRLVYSGGISLMIFGIGSFLSFILLLALNLID